MEVVEQVSISLSELQSLDNNTDKQSRGNRFALYMSCNHHLSNLARPQELLTLDGMSLPVTPIRRVACPECLQKNLPCQKCEKCIGQRRICCRGLTCVYQLTAYLNSKDAQVYRKCKCTRRFEASTQQFTIDWRLFSLIQRIGSLNTVVYNYLLNFKCGMLWITQQGLSRGGEATVVRNVFQDTFEAESDSLAKGELQQHNLRYFSNLLKERVRIWLNNKEDLDVQNLQASCQQVIEHFIAHRGLQQLKTELQINRKGYQNPYLSGPPLRSHFNLQNNTISDIHQSEVNFIQLSSAINPYLNFFYHKQSNTFLIKNAQYEKQEQHAKLKPFPVAKETQLSDVIWFKDRKGDIFGIEDDTISIFKYNHVTKKIHQKVLRKQPYLTNIKRCEALIYIAQLDRVYYFDSQDFRRSFYFDLFRPYKQQGEFSNCISVNSLHTFAIPPKIHRYDCFFRATYVLEQTTNPKKPTPVIYLLCYKKKYLPRPLCLLRVTHFGLRELKVQELVSNQLQLQEKIIDFNFEEGVHTVFRRDKCQIIAFLGKINGKFTLVQGKIIGSPKQAVVQWSLHSLSISFLNIQRISSAIQHHGPQNQQQRPINTSEPKDQEKGQTLWINDLNGFQTNNTSRFLSFLSPQNRCVEMIISLHQGRYSVQVFNTF